MSYRSSALGPPQLDRPTAAQTGTHLLKQLVKPGIIFIVCGFVVAWYGITGLTTGYHKFEHYLESHDYTELMLPDKTYKPILEHLCEYEVRQWRTCMPHLNDDSSHSQKKKQARCSKELASFEDCALKVKHARKACLDGDPNIEEAALEECTEKAM